MAVTGKFIGDFSSFTDAVGKANVSLDSLEVNSSKVQSALQRMTTGFQGQKLIQDALLVTEAVEKVGGAAALTEKEQQKVNAQLTEAIAKYKTLGQEAPKAMTDLAEATKGTQSATAKWGTDFGAAVTGMAAGLISAEAVIGGVKAAFGALTDFLRGSVESFAAAEAASKKLTVALRGMGQATPEAVKAMGDLAGSFEATTVYSGDLLQEMQALLVQVGEVTPAEMEKALTAATDLASGLGIDLEQATTLVAQAFAGNTDSLKKYGIQVDDATLKTKGVSAVLDEVQRKFGGQAAAEIDTYSGRIAQLANNWDNLKESVGKYLTESPLLELALRTTKDALDGASDGTSSFNEDFVKFLANVTPGGPGLGTWISDLTEYARQANEAARAQRELNAAKLQAPDETMAMIERDLAAARALAARKAADDRKREDDERRKAQEKADKDAEAAAKAHADKILAIRDELYGHSAIAKAQTYLAAISDVSTLSAEAQRTVNAVLGAGIEAYTRLGQTAPAAMREIYTATLPVPKITAGLGAEWDSVGEKVTVNADKIIADLKRMQDETKAYEAETRRMVDEWNKVKPPIDAAKKATDDVTQSTHQATAALFQMTQQSADQMDALARHYEFIAAQNRGKAGGAFVSPHDYSRIWEAAAKDTARRAGVQRQYEQFVTGDMPVWGTGQGATSTTNTLNVTVNNADAQGIANKLLTEMRHNGVRF